jgi:NitT/TauT family transport system substrate-binding protein
VLGGGVAAALTVPRLALSQTLEKIRVAGVPTDDMTPIFYALKSGLYAKAGLDVEFVPTSSGGAATTAVVSGAYEIGKGSLLLSLIAHIRGLPLTIVANGAIWDPKLPFSQLVVAVDSRIRKAADLNGTITSTAALHDLQEVAVNAWMDANGGDAASLKWVETPNSLAASAIEEHRIDSYGLSEPQLTAALEAKKVRALTPVLTAIAQHFVFTVFFANADWAAKHRNALNRWVRATYEAAAYTNAHKAETAPMMADITKIPLATIQKIARSNAATTTDPSMIQPAIDAAFKYKCITESFRAKEAYFNS